MPGISAIALVSYGHCGKWYMHSVYGCFKESIYKLHPVTGYF